MPRILGHELGEVLKQQFVVENKAGAGGTIGRRHRRQGRARRPTRCS